MKLLEPGYDCAAAGDFLLWFAQFARSERITFVQRRSPARAALSLQPGRWWRKRKRKRKRKRIFLSLHFDDCNADTQPSPRLER